MLRDLRRRLRGQSAVLEYVAGFMLMLLAVMTLVQQRHWDLVGLAFASIPTAVFITGLLLAAHGIRR